MVVLAGSLTIQTLMQRASLTEDKKNKEASAEAAKNNRPRKETNRISKVMNMTVLSNWNTEDANSSYGIPFSYVYVGKNE